MDHSYPISVIESKEFQVAREAGVSRAAVSKVIRNAYGVSDAMREFSDVLTAALEGDADGVISDNDQDRILKELAEARAALNAVELATRRKNAAGKPAHLRAA